MVLKVRGSEDQATLWIRLADMLLDAAPGGLVTDDDPGPVGWSFELPAQWGDDG